MLEKLNPADKAYFDIIDAVINYGEEHKDRTGVGTKRLFGHIVRFDLMESFPIITCKKASFDNSLRELIWFISGSNSISDLKELGGSAYKWWEAFAKSDNSIGPMYGTQLTNFNNQNINQLHNVIKTIKEEPTSRRILMTTYNPAQAEEGSLYVCHGLTTQLMVDNNNRLHMSTLQRSCDVGIGLQHNWISYSLLLVILCILTGKTPGVLTYMMNDIHIYSNHIDALKNMQKKSYSTPQLEIQDGIKNIEDFTMNHFKLLNYESGPLIKLPMAI